MIIYIVRASDPLDHEGSADVVDVFINRAVAEEAVELLKAAEEKKCRESYGERWSSFALYFELEAYEAETSAAYVVESFYSK